MNDFSFISIILNRPQFECEVKWFLIKLIYKLSEPGLIEIKKNGLAELLGVPRGWVSRSLGELIERDYLGKTRIYQVGRPYDGYYILPKLQNLISNNREASAQLKHDHLIDSLIMSPNRCSALKIRHPLTESEKFVLVILLLNANAGGVVDCVGLSDLSVLASMKRPRIKSLLNKLKNSGYIRAYVPGLTDSCLFKKSKSIYFLNLRHKGFGRKASGGRIYFCVGSYGGSESSYIFERAEAERKINKDALDDKFIKFKKVHAFFNDSKQVTTVEYTQAKLELFASYLLTEYWEVIPYVEASDQDLIKMKRDLKRKIGAEILLRGDCNFKIESPTPDGKIDLLCDFLCWQSIEIAKQVKNIIGLDHNYRSNSLQYSIIPGVNGLRGFSYIIDCSNADIRSVKSDFYFIDPKLGSKLINMGSFSKADEFQFGLKTRRIPGKKNRSCLNTIPLLSDYLRRTQ